MEEEQGKSQNDFALIALAEKVGQQSEQLRQLKEVLGDQEANHGKVTTAVEKLTGMVGDMQQSMSRVPELEHSDHHRFINELVKRQAAQTKFWGDLVDELKKNAVRLIVKASLVFVGLCVLLAVSQDAVKEILKAVAKAVGLPL